MIKNLVELEDGSYNILGFVDLKYPNLVILEKIGEEKLENKFFFYQKNKNDNTIFLFKGGLIIKKIIDQRPIIMIENIF